MIDIHAKKMTPVLNQIVENDGTEAFRIAYT
jgi:hypothetical protein